MIEIKGMHNTAIIYTDSIEPSAEEQIRELCDNPHFASSQIRIMPDVHAGKGCTIGTTMTLSDRVIPNMVGVDIGCGMETVQLVEKEIDLARLDEAIHRHIPCGKEIRDTPHHFNDSIDLTRLRLDTFQHDRAQLSIGTLGGGNHFIEIDRDDDGNLYLVIHSGSRHLGTEVANGYQIAGVQAMLDDSKRQITELMEYLKSEGREVEIESAVKQARIHMALPMHKDNAHVEGKVFDDYIHDMRITQAFAKRNREAIVDVILRHAGLHPIDWFTTVHNYIDPVDMILRKGAVSARCGERLLIPMNMRDGSLLCMGLGNDEWNQSAPHGAGRIMSRAEANKRIFLDQFQSEMQGIYSSSVSQSTVDEAPMAYKPMMGIIAHIGPTVCIEKILRPIYNFKAQT